MTKYSSPKQLLLSAAVVALMSSATASGQDTFYKRGLTDHFINFLGATKNYYPYHFNKTEFFGGSFGGKEDDNDTIVNRPVIFIHGAADQMIGYGWENDGFRYSIEYFL